MNNLPERSSGGLGLFLVPEELSKTAGSKTQVAPLQTVTTVSIHLIHSDTWKDVKTRLKQSLPLLASN